jgi:DNA-binding NarL/FixJ family response regulator
VFVDLTRLRELTEQLDRLEQHFTVEIDTSRQIERLADAATVLLRALCHSCIIYHLDQAVDVTLALEDLYARVVQAELVLNAALLNKVRVVMVSARSDEETQRAAFRAGADGYFESDPGSLEAPTINCEPNYTRVNGELHHSRMSSPLRWWL